MLVAVILVAAVAAALAPFNAIYYEAWIYNDPQTNEELHDNEMIDFFMAHTSGFFWGQFIALFTGAFLASHVRGMRRALLAAVPAGLLLAAVDFAVAWSSSAGVRRRLAWWTENHPGFLPADLFSDDRFHHVLAAGLAAFPLAAIAGVGLGTLIAPLLRAPAAVVATLTVVSTMLYGACAGVIGWIIATADGESAVLFAFLALLPPAAVTPSAVRTAVGDHGDAFTTTLLISAVAWASLMVIAGWLVHRRRK
ncbi:hypothetical protein E1211_05670 [Micromonospora sp. 15K316]|uniref:hypothetical protein n=1 Tax=Micromonospora sp. 15K316 TaxID=2530376 RepID=UPI0010475657|nr:hypothetical protein [Micromonospora sp. 15K316]TDC38860.1 hypothetical protein E1211_05670 [Micromonospora sp. 15K316]